MRRQAGPRSPDAAQAPVAVTVGSVAAGAWTDVSLGQRLPRSRRRGGAGGRLPGDVARAGPALAFGWRESHLRPRAGPQRPPRRTASEETPAAGSRAPEDPADGIGGPSSPAAGRASPRAPSCDPERTRRPAPLPGGPAGRASLRPVLSRLPRRSALACGRRRRLTVWKVRRGERSRASAFPVFRLVRRCLCSPPACAAVRRVPAAASEAPEPPSSLLASGRTFCPESPRGEAESASRQGWRRPRRLLSLFPWSVRSLDHIVCLRPGLGFCPRTERLRPNWVAVAAAALLPARRDQARDAAAASALPRWRVPPRLKQSKTAVRIVLWPCRRTSFCLPHVRWHLASCKHTQDQGQAVCVTGHVPIPGREPLAGPCSERLPRPASAGPRLELVRGLRGGGRWVRRPSVRGQ